MKVSIITVSYNAASTIKDTIQSVLEQTYHDIEYIVIDGASKDGTLDVINKYRSKIAQVISEPDKGIYYAMNKGIKLATGDLIGVLNADDVYAHKDIVKNIVNKISAASTETIYGDLVYIKENKVFRYWKSGHLKNVSQFKYGWMPPHPTFFVKKGIYEKLGYFNTDFKISADYELMLRFLFKNKTTCSYLPEVVVKMRLGGVSNKSVNNRLMANNEDKKAWQINNLAMPFYTVYLKPLRKIFQFRF